MKRHRLLAAVLVASLPLGAAIPSTARAEPPAPQEAPPPPGRPIPVSLVVSGGVSLGAYEAGFLYQLVEILKASPGAFDLKVATGASAGSINGLLALLSSCSARSIDPRGSLLYKTWADVGFPYLLEGERASPIALFSRQSVQEVSDRIARRFGQGFAETCDVVLGVSTTRLAPRKESLVGDPALRLPRSEERFVVRLRGRGEGQPPSLENYVDADYGFPQGLLPLDDNPAGFDGLRELLFASSAFPFAFDPVMLAHCTTLTGGRCTPRGASRALFVDGGVFDNQPLGLASRLVADGLGAASGRGGFASPLRRGRGALPEDAVFVYVDPDISSYPSLPDGADTARTRSAQSLALHYLGMFVESARSQELVSVLERSPELGSRLLIAAADTPPASQALASFFGFFDRNLRVFDFYLGMRSARRFADARIAPRARARFGEGFALGRPEQAATANIEPYRCLLAVQDGTGRPEELCASVSSDFKATLQTSLARLHDRCMATRGVDATGFGAPACSAAMHGKEPPHVPGVPPQPPGFFRRRDGESELSYVVRLLCGYGFVFRDIGLDRAEAPRVEREILHQLRKVVERFQAAQPEGGAVVGELGRALLGQLAYTPASAIVHVNIGPSLEAAASFRLGVGASRFLRATVALDLGGLSSFSAAGGAYVTVTPMAGLEAELLPISGPTLQPRVGVRGGYLFSSVDDLAISRCEDPGRRVCSRPTVQVYAALSIVDRLRLQLAFAMLPATRTGEDFSWSLLPTGGIQFLWP